MRFLLLAVALALPAAAAYAAIRRAWSEPAADVWSRALRAGLALPLGLGAASLFTYAWLLAGGTLDRAYALADFVLFASVLAAALAWRAPGGLARRPPRPDPPAARGSWSAGPSSSSPPRSQSWPRSSWGCP